MLNFGAVKAVDFLPEDSARAWVAETMQRLAQELGPISTVPRLFAAPPRPMPRDLDGLFEVMCGLQGEVGQAEIEFTLAEFEGTPVPPSYRPLAHPEGKLLHAFVGPEDYLILAMPEVFRVPEILLASVARELGRMELHRRQLMSGNVDEAEAEAELAAVLLGLGVWVANGAYRFENKCCGGGCGINLSRLRVGLSLPEVCFALALDGHRRGVSRREVLRHLEATQRAAAKRSWSFVRQSPLAALAEGSVSVLPSGTRINT